VNPLGRLVGQGRAADLVAVILRAARILAQTDGFRGVLLVIARQITRQALGGGAYLAVDRLRQTREKRLALGGLERGEPLRLDPEQVLLLLPADRRERRPRRRSRSAV